MVTPFINFDGAITQTFAVVKDFVNGDGGTFGAAIFATILTFHALVGGAELASGQPDCRLTKGSFWSRILVVGALLMAFDTIIVGAAEIVCKESMTEFVHTWVKVWDRWFDYAEILLKQQSDVINTETSAFSLVTMGVGRFIEFFISTLALVLSLIVGCICVVFMLFQAFLGLGFAAFTAAIGAIALPFGAHEELDGIAKGYAKTFLIYALLYLPLLNIGMEVSMTMVQALVTPPLGPGTSYTGIADVFEHLLSVVVAPFGALGVLMAVPHLMSSALRG